MNEALERLRTEIPKYRHGVVRTRTTHLFFPEEHDAIGRWSWCGSTNGKSMRKVQPADVDYYCEQCLIQLADHVVRHTPWRELKPHFRVK